MIEDRHRLAREFADTIERIRSLEGFDSFGAVPTPEELIAQAHHGPLVVFTTGREWCDALLVTASGITHLNLIGVTGQIVADTAASFHRAQATVLHAAGRSERVAAEKRLGTTLEWLWDAVTGPVLHALGYHDEPAEGRPWPRVWWIPDGPLGLLPLHAAGHHSDPAGHGRRTVMDRVVSSYTPTVRALAYSRRAADGVPAPTASSLVVAMPTTPGLPGGQTLPHVADEADAARRHLPDSTVLRTPAFDADADADDVDPSMLPTAERVLQRLPSCAIAHFACHGTSDPTDPSQSRLLLYDHARNPLTVTSLGPLRLEGARLAYLSACSTAAIKTGDLIDEAIHVASAFQLAGFPHVVGTLWEINDRIAVTVADRFYTHLRDPDGNLDPGRAACALHATVREVRDGADLPEGYDRTAVPSLWAAYLHTGA
ncbi:CHAT domain protein [Streptomonospora litoralis]|uniref:CHAT domain protein n=1 Tax=Streptomonospora litoralis TaxID=2498135 RepID=A0A4P6PXP3_9ACTN|nr:CHAT domain protein [Streptomonospora litoralis]